MANEKLQIGEFKNCSGGPLVVELEDSNGDKSFILDGDPKGDALLVNGKAVSYDELIARYRELCGGAPRTAISFSPDLQDSLALAIGSAVDLANYEKVKGAAKDDDPDGSFKLGVAESNVCNGFSELLRGLDNLFSFGNRQDHFETKLSIMLRGLDRALGFFEGHSAEWKQNDFVMRDLGDVRCSVIPDVEGLNSPYWNGASAKLKNRIETYLKNAGHDFECMKF